MERIGRTEERLGRPAVGRGMSIEKESDGVPQVDFARRTTKVNLWIIVAVGVFLAAGAILMFVLSKR